MNSRDEIKKEIASISHIKGRFILKSGKEATNYFDKFKFETQPRLLARLVNEMIYTLPGSEYSNPYNYWDHIDYICGLELGAIPLVVMLSHQLNIPSLFIRPVAKPYGLGTYVEGGDIVGKRIQLIEDVITTGNSILDAATKLTIDGGIVNHTIFCVIDREDEGRDNLKRFGYNLKALYTKTELENAI